MTWLRVQIHPPSLPDIKSKCLSPSTWFLIGFISFFSGLVFTQRSGGARQISRQRCCSLPVLLPPSSKIQKFPSVSTIPRGQKPTDKRSFTFYLKGCVRVSQSGVVPPKKYKEFKVKSSSVCVSERASVCVCVSVHMFAYLNFIERKVKSQTPRYLLLSRQWRTGAAAGPSVMLRT